MQILKNKTKISAITFVLVLTFAATFVALPLVSAHDPAWTIHTATFLTVNPDPVGVGQDIFVLFWLHIPTPTAQGAYGDRFEGFTVEITKPDGSKETRGPFTSDPISSAYFLYSPDQVGTYYFQASFPGQTLAGDNPHPTAPSGQESIGDYYEPSSSNLEPLTVQQEPVPGYEGTPLPDPNQYWERPISPLNREWWEISGSWLMDGDPFRTIYSDAKGYQPYSRAPNSAHIVWRRPLSFGGVIGGAYETNQYYTGMSYEQKFEASVIINGVLYYNKYSRYWWAMSAGADYPDARPRGVYAVDLRTGKELWYNDDMAIDFGQIYAYDSPNQHGAIAYLWENNGTIWNAYDPFTGDWIYTLENVSMIPGAGFERGTSLFNFDPSMQRPDGSIITYSLTSKTLTKWNSDAVKGLTLSDYGTDAWQFRPMGKTVDASTGIEWRVDIPEVPGQGIQFISDGVIVATALDTRTAYPYPFVHVGYNATTGERMWIKELTWDVPSYQVRYGPAMDGVYTIFTHKNLTFQGFSVLTGEKLWTSEPLDSGMDVYARNFAAGYADFT